MFRVPVVVTTLFLAGALTTLHAQDAGGGRAGGGRAGGGRGGRGAAAPAAQGGAPNEGRGQGGPQLTIDRDLEYARQAAVPLHLDLYHMNPVTAPSAVIVWLHGEGNESTARMTTPFAALVNNGGFAVASVDYR